MKPTKSVLLGLAGAWMLLLVMEKIVGSAGGLRVRRMALPIRLLYTSTRMLKSLVMIGLVIANVFMAIAMVDTENTRLREGRTW